MFKGCYPLLYPCNPCFPFASLDHRPPQQHAAKRACARTRQARTVLRPVPLGGARERTPICIQLTPVRLTAFARESFSVRKGWPLIPDLHAHWPVVARPVFAVRAVV